MKLKESNFKSEIIEEPINKWHAFKKKRFPGWLKCLFPVRMKSVRICPDCKSPLRVAYHVSFSHEHVGIACYACGKYAYEKEKS